MPAPGGAIDARELALTDGPTIVCAQAGEVNTGACDPLDAIADAAREHGAWLHVDGAFGLWAAAAPSLRHLVQGAERADSWAVDAHKWLNVPYDGGLAIVADRAALNAAMGVAASYLPQEAGREPIAHVPESSRRARAMPVYAALRQLGRAGIAELVERNCALARRAADGLRALGAEILNDVVLNQVLVRFDDDDEATRAAVAAVQRSGEAWLGGTVWEGRAAIRVSVSNWSTTEADIDRLVAAFARRAVVMAASNVADEALAAAGEARIEWAGGQMPVLRSIQERFARERPLEGIVVGACLHVTSETANLVRALAAGGADVALCASNPFATQDDVAAALASGGTEVHAVRGDDADAWAARVAAVVARGPRITLDDGADLLTALHLARPDLLDGLLGGTEETTTGLVRLRALEAEGKLACPVIAVNEAFTERVINDRFGTGQSALDGILRTTNLLLAGRTLVVLGYGWAGKGIALRGHGLGASVIVCEVDPLRALEARMDGFEVLPALEAAERGDVFVTVTGGRDVLRGEHFERMKDGAVLANAGHFDVEIDLEGLRAAGRRRARGPPAGRAVHARRAAAEPARRRAGRQPGRRRGPSGGGDGHLVRAPGARGRGPRAPRRRAPAGRAPGARRDRPRGGGAQARLARRPDRHAERRAGAVPARLGGRLTAMDGLQASVEKMRREGLPERGDRHLRPLLPPARRGRDRHAARVRDRAGRGRRRSSTTCPTTDAPLDAGGGDQAQRRPRHEHGHDPGQVADRGQGRAHVPRRHRPPGAGAARARRARGCRSCS